MNYLKEILTFYDRIEQRQLSASAVSLWHGLVYTNNKARWAEKFTASAPVLHLRTGLPSSSFKRARKELVDKGYIHYESRGRNLAPVYQLVELSEMNYEIMDVDDSYEDALEVNAKEGSSAGNMMDNMAGNVTDKSMDKLTPADEMDQDVAQGMDQSMGQGVDQSPDHYVDHHTGPLYKHKQNEIKPKQKENILSMDIRIFYTENFIGKLTTHIRTAMEEQVREFGEPMVMEAMKRAVERNKLSWGYANAICNGWKKKGITTLQQVRADEEAFRKHHSYQGASLGRKEIIPDWFKDRHKYDPPKKQVEEDEMSSEEIARMLAAISSKKGEGADEGLVPS